MLFMTKESMKVLRDQVREQVDLMTAQIAHIEGWARTGIRDANVAQVKAVEAYELAEEATDQIAATDVAATARIAEVEARFAEVEARFAEVEARFAEVEARFAEVEAAVTRLQELYEGLGSRFEKIAPSVRIEDGVRVEHMPSGNVRKMDAGSAAP